LGPFTEKTSMKKLILLNLMILSTNLWAQSPKDFIRKMADSKFLDPASECYTCKASERSGHYTPQQALEDINSGKLTFMGRDLFPGSDQNRTCVYKSETAYILYNNCMSSKKEAPATDIEVISFNGGIMKFYVENGKIPDPISTLDRSQYDSTWTVSYLESAVPGALNVNDLKRYKERFNTSQNKGGCYVGGSFQAQNMSQKGVCYGNLKDKAPNWIRSSETFWRNPGEEWNKTKKYLRKTVVDTKF